MTVFNLLVAHFKYTFDFVIGLYILELVTKSLISAIAGHLHIPDFWVKIAVHGKQDAVPDRPKSKYSGFLDYDYKRMTKEENDALVKKLLDRNEYDYSKGTIEERLKRH